MNIAVVMGGYSDESVISLRSGQLILNNLDHSKHNIFEVHILVDGWNAVVADEKHPINKGDFSFESDGVHHKFDVVINTIHGTPGEDGHMQAYWELLGIPYTGCSFYQSGLTFNKRDTLSVLSKFDISKAKSIYLSKGDVVTGAEIVATLGIPFFVKPNQSGSSLGVSMVSNLDQLEKALESAFAEDSDILLESYLKGIEVSVGVLKYKGETKVLALTEIVSENAFFDYEAKYLGKADEITPARVSPQVEKLVYEAAAKVYEALGMSGFSRSEFIIMDGVPHFIEINTNPGLSPQSIFPQQVKYANLELQDLFHNEIELAFSRKILMKQ